MTSDKSSGGPDVELYPDVSAMGSLAAAIEDVSRKRGIDLGDSVTVDPATPFGWAGIASVRGTIGVGLQGGRRGFLIGIGSAQVSWATGVAESLTNVVELADLWRRGATLRELKARFPFMDYSRIAQAYEDGNDLEVRWQILLNESTQHRIQPLLRAVRANERLAMLHPLVSHRTFLRLQKVYLDKSAGEVFIDISNDGVYDVTSSWCEAKRTVRSIDEAVAAAEAMLQ